MTEAEQTFVRVGGVLLTLARWLLLVVIWGVCLLAASAGCFARASNPYQPSYTPYVALAIYGAGLAAEPQNPPQQQGDVFKRLDAIEKKLDALITLLNKLFEEEEPPKPQVGQPNPVAFVRALSVCARCHAPDTAKEKGEGFVLFEQKRDGLHLKQLAPRELKAVRRELSAGTMPPDPKKVKDSEKLTDAEYKALLDTIK